MADPCDPGFSARVVWKSNKFRGVRFWSEQWEIYGI
jgi:hypothetical protein